ncbi:MAG: hypothetical protein H8E62_03330 [Planctomycetes bacterium]|nr:hypothetical protein [Planctomycetota bacterium]
MKLPDVKEATKYIGLYVVDFGDHSGVGFTATEVAELLDSEQYADVHIYKIHRAYPDGKMELKGVTSERFGLEAGMFFYAADETTAKDDFTRLLAWAETQLPPSRCKVHLSEMNENYLTALIYPAEFDDEFSRWLLDGQYRTIGTVEGGASAVGGYYDACPQILEQKQLWPATALESLHGEALFEAAKRAFVR